MTLDMLLFELRVWQCLLISESEIWPSSYMPLDELRQMKRALRKHRRGLRLLLRESDISTCPARDLHRREWRYSGGGRFVCQVCEEIAV